jgi:hypothetical protein
MALLGQSILGGGSSAYGSVLAPDAAFQAGVEAVMRTLTLDLTNLVQKEMPAFNVFKTNSVKWSGREGVAPLKLANPGSFSGVGEGGVLPAASASLYQETKFPRRFAYGQMALSGPALAACADKGSLVNLLSTESEGLIDNTQWNFQRMLWGDGTGRLVECESYAAGVVTIEDVAADLTNAGTPTNVSRLVENMNILCAAAANIGSVYAAGTHGAGRIVDVLSDTTFKIDTGSWVGLDPANTFLVTCGDSGGAFSYNKEFTGLGSMLDNTATLQGLAPATFPMWQSGSLSFGTDVPLDDTMLNRLALYHKQRNKQKVPNLGLAHSAMENEFFKAVVGDRRYVNRKDYGLGFSDIAYSYQGKEIPMMYDDMAPRGSILYLDKKMFFYAWQKALGWQLTQFTGGSIFRPDPANTDQGIATYGAYGQFVTYNRRAISKGSGFQYTYDFAG